jgi:hypothetical protein
MSAFRGNSEKHLLIPSEAAWGFTMDFTKHEKVVDEWLAAFAAALDQRNIDRVLDLFEPKAFWRDLATFTWNIYTAEGRDAWLLIGTWLRIERAFATSPLKFFHFHESRVA